MYPLSGLTTIALIVPVAARLVDCQKFCGEDSRTRRTAKSNNFFIAKLSFKYGEFFLPVAEFIQNFQINVKFFLGFGVWGPGFGPPAADQGLGSRVWG